jgi:hypothetical protein
MRHMLCAAVVLGGVIAASLPAGAQAPSPKTVFQDNYADVNG